MIKKTISGNTTKFSAFGIPLFKYKVKSAKYKIYILGITIATIPKLKFFKKNNKNSINKFVENFYNEDNSTFVEFIKNGKPLDTQTKLIAYYLPQFHQIELNDKNFGRGFTEWDNTTKAKPHFDGHYQPHLPIDTGFYNLSTDTVMKRQIELAKNYGIHGFCFHYYWFSGKRLLEKPIFNWLNNKELNLPFCFCWANENWSKLWDGGKKELILKQELKNDDATKFFNDILMFFKDDRYIKIDNKPLLIIYNPTMFDKTKFLEFNKQIRTLAKDNGFDDIYLLATGCRGFDAQKEWHFDGIAEFPPHAMKKLNLYSLENKFLNPKFVANIFDMQDYINNKHYLYKTQNNVFKALFPSWDNTARKAYTGAGVYYGETPNLYKNWLKDLIHWTKENHKDNEQIIFINAWNEWAEGAHLEPDKKYGYAYLQATKEALEESAIKH